MRESERIYATHADAVAKCMDDLETRMAAIEKKTSDKLNNITDLLEKIKRK